MLTVTGLWFDHERTPVGLDHTPVFGWQLEGNCRNIRQTPVSYTHLTLPTNSRV